MAAHTRTIDALTVSTVSTGGTGLVLFSEPASNVFGAGATLGSSMFAMPVLIAVDAVADGTGGGYGMIGVSYLFRAVLFGDPDNGVEQYLLVSEQIGTRLLTDATDPSNITLNNVAVSLASGNVRVIGDSTLAGTRITVRVSGFVSGG